MVHKIKGIPISMNATKDSFCWGLDSSSEFSTKSATCVAHGFYNQERSKWLFNWIWKINTVPKLKFSCGNYTT